jgi:outer membrane protein assembly factor BamB
VDYPAWGSPSADGDTVFFGLGNGNFIESAEEPKGRVTARNAQTGEQIWEYEAEDSVLTAVVYRNGFVYFGSRDGGVYALNAADGALGWKSPIGHPVVSSPAVTESSVYVGADNGVIYKIDIDSGRIVWQFDTDKITGGEPIYSSPVIANGKLYIGLRDYLLCLGGEETMKGTLELEDQ